LLTEHPVREADYEYDLYKRATALYPACPSDGYELLRFGRILASQPTLTGQSAGSPPPVTGSLAGNPHPVSVFGQCATWVQVTYASGQRGYIDISDAAIKMRISAMVISRFGERDQSGRWCCAVNGL
jgi:hypothetical protein